MSDLENRPAPEECGVRHPHKTVPLQVWVDVDEGIKPVVAYLNTVPGIRTLASCQGTLGEDGPEPYAPYVYVTWESESALRLLRERFSVNVLGESFGTVHPKEGMDYSTPDAAQEHVPLVAEIRRRLEATENEHSMPPVNDLAMMLRRMIWQINKLSGDSSLKVLAGKAQELLNTLRMNGNPLRDEASENPPQESECAAKLKDALSDAIRRMDFSEQPVPQWWIEALAQPCRSAMTRPEAYGKMHELFIEYNLESMTGTPFFWRMVDVMATSKGEK